MMEENNNEITNEWLYVDDCAKFLGCHPATIRKHIKTGKLRAFKVGTQEFKIQKNDFKIFLDSLRFVVERKEGSVIDKMTDGEVENRLEEINNIKNNNNNK
jgi:excisionase family DNA binding protein